MKALFSSVFQQLKVCFLRSTWLTAAVLLCLPNLGRAIPDPGDYVWFNDFEDFGCNQAPGGAGSPTPGADNAGGNDSSCPTCPSPTGMPRWWVDEPYINLHVVDEPVSYTTSSGQPLDFRIYYKQNFALPTSNQVPDFYTTYGYGPRSNDGQDVTPYVYAMRQYGGTSEYQGGMVNAAWMNNWQEYIVLWDYGWETAYAESEIGGPPVTFGPFSDGYEALAFMPNGGVSYFTSNATNQSLNPSSQLRDPVSQVQFSSYPFSYPSPTNTPVADSHGIYWGNPTNGVMLTYPNGSKDVFGLTWWSGLSGLTTAGALLTQRIDPQGRITQLGYAKISVTNACNASQVYNMYALTYIVDTDSRTNTLSYNGTTPNSILQLQEIQDPFGRKATFGYEGCSDYNNYLANAGWLTNVVDEWGMSNSFTYSLSGYSVSDSGYLGSIVTPYGTDSFSYQALTEAGEPTNYTARAMYVTEPDGASQLFGYYHNTTNLLPNSLASPAVPSGWVFDNGSTGDAEDPLCLRNSFFWGRKQMANLTNSPVLNFLRDGLSAQAIGVMTSNDFQIARTQHWLLDTDGISVTQVLSSQQDPSPANNGSIVGARTWYAYTNGTGKADVLSTPQIGSVAQTLPDRTSQYTLYGYYSTGLVASNVQSYSVLGGGVGQLTNWFTYAANGIDLTEVNNSLGQYIDTGYNANHQVVSATNALGQVTTLGWNSTSHNLASVAFIDGQTVSLSYYPSNVSSTGSFLSNITVVPEGRSTYIVNYTNALPQVVHATGASLPDLWLTNSWDMLNRPTGTVFQDGTSISNIYLNLDLQATKDRVGNWTHFVYDGLQHLIFITNALSKVTELAWCSCGSLTSISNALGYITDLGYNNQELLTNVDFPDGSSLNWQYDLSQRMTNRFDGAGNSQRYTYNNQNQVIAINNTYGQLFGAYFDAVGRPVWITNANGVVVSNSFDLISRLTGRYWLGGGNEYFAYATNGLIAYTNQDNQWTHYGRDTAGRLIALTNAVQKMSFAYDALDDLISLTDGLSHNTTWGFNQYGWLIGKTNTLGSAMILYSYDANGRVTNRWMAGTNTGYKFDAVGNLTNINYPANSVSFSYDANNELLTMVDQVGTSTFTWTSNSLLASETSPWTSNTLSYGYSQGHRTSLSLTQPSGSWSQTYGYDNAWRMTSLTSSAGTFGYAYPSPINQYRVGGITLPNGASILNQYDTLSRLTSTALLNYWGHALDGYVYGLDALGLRTNVTRQLGLTTNIITASYDGIGELSSWTAKESSGTPRQNEQLGYGYDAGNNLYLRTNNALVQTFTVNSLNQLNNVTRTGTLTVSGALPAPASSVTVNSAAAQTNGDFTFANTNNTLASGTNTFTIIAKNVYGAAVTNTLVVNLPSSNSFQYDANGNLTNDGTRSFTYDSENRLTNVAVAGQYQTAFTYDGLSRRRITTNFTWLSGAWTVTNVTRYIYDGMIVLQERNTNNTPLVTYTRGLDLSTSLAAVGGVGGMLARTDTNDTTFYHADGNGNITALTDTNANIVARCEYDGFGRPIGMWGTNAAANVYRFSSKEYDSMAGLYYFGRRYYDPVLQRFLNQDPIQEAGGFNMHSFVGNSPINNIDPFGLQVPAPMNFVVGFGPGYGESVADYNARSQAAANTSLPMIVGALAATATGGLADAGLVGTGLMSPGIASGFATGALAASAGDAASQATAMALGNQQNFDPGQMAAAGATGGLLGGAAAGVAKAMSKPCPPKMGKGIVHNDQVVAHAPIEAVASHEALARQSGTLLTPPLAGTPGQLIPGAEAFTYTAQGGNVFVTGSMNFNQNVSVNVVQVVTRYVNGN